MNSHVHLFETAMYQTMWYWYKDKHVDQCRKTDTTETDSLINDKLIFDNGAKVSNAESNFKNYSCYT